MRCSPEDLSEDLIARHDDDDQTLQHRKSVPEDKIITPLWPKIKMHKYIQRVHIFLNCYIVVSFDYRVTCRTGMDSLFWAWDMVHRQAGSIANKFKVILRWWYFNHFYYRRPYVKASALEIGKNWFFLLSPVKRSFHERKIKSWYNIITNINVIHTRFCCNALRNKRKIMNS